MKAMIRRLLLSLLVLCLAVPATAAPVAADRQAPAAHAMPGHGDHDHGDHGPAAPEHAATHLCIGCAAPSTGGTGPGEPPHYAEAPPTAREPAALTGQRSAPDTPPPRF